MSGYAQSSTEEFGPKAFYLPCRHPELVAAALPGEVRFLNPGLPLSAAAESAERIWTPQGLPYDPPGAARCLQDLIAEGELLERDSLLAAAAGNGAGVSAAASARPLEASERASLNAFAHMGRYEPGALERGAGETLPSSAREQAQKLLLLAAHLEENILAARKLALEISAGEAALHELLLEGDQAGTLDAPPPDMLAAGGGLLEQCLSRWAEILRAWLVFLPSGMVFYTADFSALPGLEADGARPVPPEEAGRFFPASVEAGWTFTGMTLDGFGREVRLFSGRCP